MLGWTLLNLLQAGTLGLHSDEAYYWVYSRFLDWGYYDHPPMVALFIKAGYAVFKNTLGLRLITVISSAGALRLLWLIARRYNPNPWHFIAITGGIFIFHIYGFITTPDAPLFFFTVLFYYLYRQYLEQDRWQLAVLIAVTLACLLYSKYHGILLIGFTLLANLKILRRPTFWLVPVIAVVLYLPHIYWQVSRGYPSINYHLFERSSEVYDFAHTYQFLPGQLLMAGPLIGWLLFYLLIKVKVSDVFIRTLIVNAIGTFLFFLISTLKGNVQPHWTLIAFVPLCLLALIYFGRQVTMPVWFRSLAWANIAVIVAFRLLLASGLPFVKQFGAVKSFFGYEEWCNLIRQRAGNAYVIFSGGFQEPSKYNFYTRSLKGFSYDNRFYRRTQYDLWPLENRLQHQRCLYVMGYRDTCIVQDSVNTGKGMLYLNWIDDVRTYQRINIKSDRYKVKATPQQRLTFHLSITNPYPYPISFSNEGQQHKVFFGACFIQGEQMTYAVPADSAFHDISLKPHETVAYTFNLTAPPQKGNYDLIFSLRTEPFPGGRNSRIVNFTVQ